MTPAPSDAVADLARLLGRGRTVVLTGAGLSTESGIPDYRGPTGLARSAVPMTYGEFTGSEEARRRYWARSFAGWPAMRAARPNAGHHAVAALQAAGAVDAVITQNVDGLHRAAGSRDAVELHGALRRVVCLTCGDLTDRDLLQRRLATENPGFAASATASSGSLRPRPARPDGDVALPPEAVLGFTPVGCTACGGTRLKPDVVFFGENVPRSRVAHCFQLVDAASALLVLGSSLTVMSGYRFVRHAARRGIAVAIVNSGATRGDGEATVRVDGPLGAVLTTAVPAVTGRTLAEHVGSGVSAGPSLDKSVRNRCEAPSRDPRRAAATGQGMPVNRP